MKKIVREYAIVTIGAFIVALAVFFFMIPSNISVGSISGLSVMLSRVLPVPVSVVLFGFNALLVVIGFLFLGKEFVDSWLYYRSLWHTFSIHSSRCFDGIAYKLVKKICYF
jgi:uncharacterized membrane-anchored protein YitT (DUF2179 family)